MVPLGQCRSILGRWWLPWWHFLLLSNPTAGKHFTQTTKKGNPGTFFLPKMIKSVKKPKNLKLHKFTSQYLSQLFYYFKHIVIGEASRLRICKYFNFPIFFLVTVTVTVFFLVTVTVTVSFLVTVCEKWGVSKVDGKVDDGVDDRHFLWKESAPFISNGEQSKLPTPLSLSSPLSLTDPLSSIWHFRHEALDNDNGDNDHQQQWPQQ